MCLLLKNIVFHKGMYKKNDKFKCNISQNILELCRLFELGSPTNEVFKRKLVETKENWNEKCKK